jgi:hypothetical protein
MLKVVHEVDDYFAKNAKYIEVMDLAHDNTWHVLMKTSI